jgi:hypothetical protein
MQANPVVPKNKLANIQLQPFLNIRMGEGQLTQDEDGLSVYAQYPMFIAGGPFCAKVVVRNKPIAYIVCAFASEQDILKCDGSR